MVIANWLTQRKRAHPRIGHFQIAAEPIGEYISTLSNYQITITIAQQNYVLCLGQRGWRSSKMHASKPKLPGSISGFEIFSS